VINVLVMYPILQYVSQLLVILKQVANAYKKEDHVGHMGHMGHVGHVGQVVYKWEEAHVVVGMEDQFLMDKHGDV
jgi:hypothetical protein